MENNLLNGHLGNLILALAVVAWAIAQVLKVVIVLIQNHRLDFRRITGSGGMPSSHSAFVCACASATGNLYGWSSPIFALAAVLAIVEMKPELFGKELKEFLGHTPVQVIAGAVLGIVIGLAGTWLFR